VQLATVATVTLLISGYSRVTTVSERRDYKSPSDKQIEMTESWVLPEFLKNFISGGERILEVMFYQHSGGSFVVSWLIVWFIVLCVALRGPC
jgi:hypothetical protein